MAEALIFNAEKREDTGKSGARALRREGRIPAIIYGGGAPEVKISLDEKELVHAINRGNLRSIVVEIKAGKETFRALTREVQLDPVKDSPVHADFQRITGDDKLKVMVRVRFINEEKSPGIKRGAFLNVVRRYVEMICDPNNVPESLTVDLDGLQIGDSIHISHLDIPEGVVPVINRDFTVATLLGRGGRKSASDEEGEEGAETEAEAAE